MVNKLLFPGWYFDINVDLLEFYKIEFRQSKQSSYLVDLTFRGEYISSHPFGLFEDSNQLIVILKPQIVNDFNLQIGDNFGELKEEVTPNIVSTTGLKVLLKTTLDFIMFDLGYEKPFNTRGCLGKYSKG